MLPFYFLQIRLHKRKKQTTLYDIRFTYKKPGISNRSRKQTHTKYKQIVI